MMRSEDSAIRAVGDLWLRLAGAARASAGSRRWSASYAGAGYPKTLISSHGPLSNIERGHGEWLLIGCPRNAGCARCREARTGPASRNGLSVKVSVGECDLPAEACEFAGDGDCDDAVGLVAGVFELAPAGVQSPLRTPGDVDYLGGLAALAALERPAYPRMALVVIGGLDQQAAGVSRARFGDRALAALLAGGVFRGDDPEIAGQAVGVLEAIELADLGARAMRREGVDPA